MELSAAPETRDLEAPTGPRHLSPSSAGTYQQCPKRWEFRYIHRLPDPPGVAALAGTFAHRVLEDLLQLPPADRTIDRARLIAREVWPETEDDEDYQALELDEDEARQLRWRGWLAIEGLWKLEDPAAVEVRATEQNIETVINGVPFRGIVDRLDVDDEHLVITDYKSGRAPSPRFSGDRLAQVLLYAAAIEADTGERPTRAKLLYLGQKIVETEVTDEALAAVTEELRSTWDALSHDYEHGVFEERTGPLCAWCPYVSSCTAGADEVRKRHELGTVRFDAPAVETLGLTPLAQAS